VSALPSAAERYLTLLKRSLMGELYPAPAAAPSDDELARCAIRLQQGRAEFPHVEGDAAAMLASTPQQLFAFLHSMSARQRKHTMTAESGVDNVRECVESALADGVPGDLLEAGVWKGGLPLFMRGILAAHEVTDRRVWLADSFEGLPEPNPETDPDDAVAWFLTDGVSHLAVSLDDVKETFRHYDLLDDQVRFLVGWFADTLPDAPIESLAVMRLDGDWYDSTRDALAALYPKLSPGGFVIIDDYGLPLGCRRAVNEYREANGIEDEIVTVNEQTVYWRRSR
jgi:hypothetical protein